MKRIIIAGIALLLTLHTFAQHEEPPKPPPPEKRWEMDSKKISEAITLSPTQTEKLKKAFFSFYTAMDGMHEKYPQSRPPKEEMDKLHEKRNEEVKKLLTAEQYAKFTEVEKRLGPPKRREGGPKPPVT